MTLCGLRRRHHALSGTCRRNRGRVSRPALSYSTAGVICQSTIASLLLLRLWSLVGCVRGAGEDRRSQTSVWALPSDHNKVQAFILVFDGFMRSHRPLSRYSVGHTFTDAEACVSQAGLRWSTVTDHTPLQPLPETARSYSQHTLLLRTATRGRCQKYRQ